MAKAYFALAIVEEDGHFVLCNDYSTGAVLRADTIEEAREMRQNTVDEYEDDTEIPNILKVEVMK